MFRPLPALWAGNRNPNRQGGFYLFDVGVFSSLEESSPWPILDLRGLVYRLDTAEAEVKPFAATGVR